MRMAQQSLRIPSGYEERVRIALGRLPGTNVEKAKVCGVHATQVGRWMSGEGHCSNPEPLAAALNVSPGVLVYGPTTALRVQLGLPAEDPS